MMQPVEIAKLQLTLGVSIRIEFLVRSTTGRLSDLRPFTNISKSVILTCPLTGEAIHWARKESLCPQSITATHCVGAGSIPVFVL